jgi:hypothetical protein
MKTSTPVLTECPWTTRPGIPCRNSSSPPNCDSRTWSTLHGPPLATPRPVDISKVLYGTRTRPAIPAWTNPADLPRPSGTRNNCTRYDTYLDVPADAKWLKCCNPNYCFIKANFWGSKVQPLLVSSRISALDNECLLTMNMTYLVNETQLIEWNPSLMHNVSDDSPRTRCLLKKGYGYCVAI